MWYCLLFNSFPKNSFKFYKCHGELLWEELAKSKIEC